MKEFQVVAANVSLSRTERGDADDALKLIILPQSSENKHLECKKLNVFLFLYSSKALEPR